MFDKLTMRPGNSRHSVETATPFFFQPKLRVNNPGDTYEKEADAIADKVIRMETPSVQPKPISVSALQRKCADCEEEKKLQRKEIKNEESSRDTGFEHYAENLNNRGVPLPGEVRNFYEPRFGYDFSRVRLHTDTAAAKSAHSINALAYTSGNNIVFGSGQYSPGTSYGKHLLAHELTHVVQQLPTHQSTHTVQQKINGPAVQRLVKRSLVTNCEGQSDKAFGELQAAEQSAFNLLRKGTKRIELALEQYQQAMHEKIVPDENDLKKFDEAYKVGKHFRTAFGFSISKSATWDSMRIARARFMGTLSYLNSVVFDYNCCENDETCPKVGAHQCREKRFAFVIAEDNPNLIILCPDFWSSSRSRGLTLAHEVLHLWGRGLIKDTTTEVFGIVKETPRFLDANRYEMFLRLLNS